MRDEVKRALVENARPQMEGGEEASAVMLGQTGVTPWLYLLIFPLVFIFIVRSRAVALTERNIYVIDQSIWKQKEVQAVRRYPRGTTQFEVTALGVKVADEDPIYALLGQGDEKKKIAAAVATAPA